MVVERREAAVEEVRRSSVAQSIDNIRREILATEERQPVCMVAARIVGALRPDIPRLLCVLGV